MATTTTPADSISNDSQIAHQLEQFAVQLGTFAGTIHGRAEGWLHRDTLKSQLTDVRNAAASLLRQVAPGRAPKKRAPANRRTSSPTRKAAGADPAHAPGKRRRKPAPSAKGVKHSDERIAKLRAAQTTRQRRKY